MIASFLNSKLLPMPKACRLGQTFLVGLSATTMLTAFPLSAEEEVEVTAVEETQAIDHGPRYRIDKFLFEYVWDNPLNPPEHQLQQMEVKLVRTEEGFVAPWPGHEGEWVSLWSEEEKETYYHRSALIEVVKRVSETFQEWGLAAVYAEAHPDDITDEGVDLRADGETGLRIAVQLPVVSEVHTIASGRRFKKETVDLKAHRRVRDNAPIGVGGFILKNKLNDYIYLLNRHPGRTVEANVCPGEHEGEACMDFRVCEAKPWTAYFQVANSGTKSTSRWRESFGFRHNQLFGRDDIFLVNYTTAGFDNMHAANVSYEGPLFDWDCIRWRTEGSYAEFTASDLGDMTDSYVGRSYGTGGRLIWTALAYDRMFLDLFFGYKSKTIFVKSYAGNNVTSRGHDQFLPVLIGGNFERFTDNSSTVISAYFERNLEVVGTTEEASSRLGRTGVSDDWFIFHYDVKQAVYVESLMEAISGNCHEGCKAHQLEFRIQGQNTLANERVPPQFQMSIGGMHTVRGYREALGAGDNAFVVTGEYRFYIPRCLSQRSDATWDVFGRTFRWAPDDACGRTDWDWILSTYLDYGCTHQNQSLSFESDYEMLGTGIGMELLFMDYVRLRADWSIALISAGSGNSKYEAGRSRGHFNATVLY